MASVNWYGYQNRPHINVAIDTDPTDNDQVFPLFRAPVACEIREAYVAMTDAVAAHGTNWVKLSLMNGGAAGTATTAISSVAGGTAGWSALLPVALTMSRDRLAAGEVLVLKYDENGTVTPGVPMLVQLKIQMNKGQETGVAEIDTAKTAIDTLKASMQAEVDQSDYYVSDTVEFMRSMVADLDKMSRRLADDETECGIRWKDRL